METAIISIVCIALIVIGGMTMSQGFLKSVDSTTSGLNQISLRHEDMMRTNIVVSAIEVASANQVVITLINNGQTKLASFNQWDIIIQYYDDSGNYYSRWLPYTEGIPDNNQWGINGIYIDGGKTQLEAFEPGIVNSSEVIEIIVVLNPQIGRKTTNMITVSTPNGVTCSSFFTRS